MKTKRLNRLIKILTNLRRNIELQEECIVGFRALFSDIDYARKLIYEELERKRSKKNEEPLGNEVTMKADRDAIRSIINQQKPERTYTSTIFNVEFEPDFLNVKKPDGDGVFTFIWEGRTETGLTFLSKTEAKGLADFFYSHINQAK